MRKATPASAKRRAWQSFAKYIRDRDPECITCGKPTAHAGHFFHTTDKEGTKTLGGNEIWYEERNVHGQCAPCNLYKSGNQIVYTLYVQRRYGINAVQELQKLFNTPRKYTVDELLAVEELYKRKLNGI